MLAGAGLAWDAGRCSRQASPAEVSPAEASAATASPVEASPAEAGPAEAQPGGGRPGGPGGRRPDRDGRGASARRRGGGRRPSARHRRRSPPGRPAGRGPAAAPALLAAGLAGGVLYAVVVGSFSRYSWPATVPVAGLGAVVVAIGWRGPRHTRPAPPRPPLAGLALWGAVFVAACLWELWCCRAAEPATSSTPTRPSAR